MTTQFNSGNINRIRHYLVPGSHSRAYGVSRVLTNRNESFSETTPIVLSDEAPYSNDFIATRKSIEALNLIFTLPGVLKITFKPYEIIIDLADVFDWSEVHDTIIAIIKDVYFSNESAVQVEGVSPPYIGS